MREWNTNQFWGCHCKQDSNFAWNGFLSSSLFVLKYDFRNLPNSGLISNNTGVQSNVLLPYVFFLKIVLTPPKQHQRRGWRILIPRARFILVLSDSTWVRISLPRFWSIQDRRLSVGECVYRGRLSEKSNETNWIWEEWPRWTSLTCGTNTRYSESKPELPRLVFFPVWFKSCIVLVFFIESSVPRFPEGLSDPQRQTINESTH